MVESTILKSKYGSDIRKKELHHQGDLSFNDLTLKIQGLYNIKPTTAIHLKYRDEETGERPESPVEQTISCGGPVATIDPSRHEQVESNGIISHTKENGVIPQEQPSDFLSQENKLKQEVHQDQLENIPIDEKPQFNTYQPEQPKQQPFQQPLAPQPVYGYSANPALPTQPQGYPPHSTPNPTSTANYPPVSNPGYAGYNNYAPPATQTPVPAQQPSAPTPQAGYGYPAAQQVPPTSYASSALGIAPPPSAGGVAPPPVGPPGAYPPGVYNPFARGAPTQQPGAFNRPGFGGNY